MATPVCDLGDLSFSPLYQAWATGDGNQGSREPKKAAGVQITRS